MRTRLAVASLAAAALLLPAAARAQPALALRLAYAPAMGDLARGVPMSDAMSSQIPFQLDLLWRIGRISAGAYGSWGPGQVGGEGCLGGGSCSASVLRAGAQGILALAPLGETGITPWAGLGLGWEWAKQRRAHGGATASTTWSGAELSLQGGAEWSIAGRFGVGPFVLLGLGRYARQSVDTSIESASADIDRKAVHVWVHVGLRGRVDF
ncbi:MAG TPA: hypothetical protein VFK90_04640 [Anaeromyxobacter sp.]|nr:hypothetical protein [Anaeromyxobacter sp.]